jgi:hypothetical protein
LRDVLSRSFDRIDLMNAALDRADKVIDKQKTIIDALEKRDELRIREIDALQRALTAEEKVTLVYKEKAELAEARIQQIEKKNSRNNKLKTVALAVAGILFFVLK